MTYQYKVISNEVVENTGTDSVNKMWPAASGNSKSDPQRDIRHVLNKVKWIYKPILYITKDLPKLPNISSHKQICGIVARAPYALIYVCIYY
jgi:hypothetical protein